MTTFFINQISKDSVIVACEDGNGGGKFAEFQRWVSLCPHAKGLWVHVRDIDRDIVKEDYGFIGFARATGQIEEEYCEMCNHEDTVLTFEFE